MNYVIVDVETTGGHTKDSKITELAMYKHDGKQVIDHFQSLVDPEQAIPEFIVRLTGITDKMVAGAPKFYELAKQIMRRMGTPEEVAAAVLFLSSEASSFTTGTSFAIDGGYLAL